MSTHPTDFDSLAAAWLAEGPTQLNDSVLDASLREIASTRQRRPRAPWRAWPMLTLSIGGARLAASATLVALVVGSSYLVLQPRSSAPGSATPGTPTAGLTPGASEAAEHCPAVARASEVHGTAIDIGGRAGSIASAGCAIFVAIPGDGIVRIDPATNQVVASIPLAGEPVAEPGGGTAHDLITVASDGRAIWAAIGNSAAASRGRLVRIDPATNGTTTSIPISVLPRHLTIAGGRAWITDLAGNGIVVIDLATQAVVTTVPAQDPAMTLSAFDAIWVAYTRASAVTRVDPARFTTSAFPLDRQSNSLAATAGGLWAGCRGICRLDPTSGTVTAESELAIDGHPVGAVGPVGPLDGGVYAFVLRPVPTLFRLSDATPAAAEATALPDGLIPPDAEFVSIWAAGDSLWIATDGSGGASGLLRLELPGS